MIAWLAIDQDSDDARLPDEIAGDIINLVQLDYLQRRESKLGEYTYVFQTVANTADYELPAGFSKPRKLWYINSDNKAVVLPILNKDKFDVTYPQSSLLMLDGLGDLLLSGGGFLELEGGGTFNLTDFDLSVTTGLGTPEAYTLWMEKLVLGKAPDSSILMFFDCYRNLPDLEDGAPNNENRFTREAWNYLLFAGLVKAAEFGFETARLSYFEAEMMKAEQAIDLEDARQQTTGRSSQSEEPG